MDEVTRDSSVMIQFPGRGLALSSSIKNLARDIAMSMTEAERKVFIAEFLGCCEAPAEPEAGGDGKPEDGGSDAGEEVTMTESDMALHDAIAMVAQMGGQAMVIMPGGGNDDPDESSDDYGDEPENWVPGEVVKDAGGAGEDDPNANAMPFKDTDYSEDEVMAALKAVNIDIQF